MYFFKNSCNRILAKVLPFTGSAVATNPNIVELVHGLLNQFWVVGEDAGLEVAGVFSKNSKDSFHQKRVEAPVFGEGNVLGKLLLLGIFPNEFRKELPKRLAVMVMFEVCHFVKDDIIHQLLGKYDDIGESVM